MTLEILEERVQVARAQAVACAQRCEPLVSSGNLEAAFAVCKEFLIAPPQCSLTAKSPNAESLRNAAGRKLSDPRWWSKSLETQAIRNYESEQFTRGGVTNFVSDGLVAYHVKHKVKR